MNKGILYGVSTGPGDPELMTIKAINTIKQADVIAFPGKDVKDAVAYNIALQMVPEILDKTLLMLEMPMSKDRERIAETHKQAAVKIKEFLAVGKDVADHVYISEAYLQRGFKIIIGYTVMEYITRAPQGVSYVNGQETGSSSNQHIGRFGFSLRAKTA